MSVRATLVAELAERVLALGDEHPILVGIEGRSAAGKTTLADALATAIETSKRPVLRASIDDFHPPGYAHLARERAFTPEIYFDRGYDYRRFREDVVTPLETDGERRCCLKHWDSLNDRAHPPQWVDAPGNVVLVVDGGFLFHPTLEDAWRFAVWLHIDWDTMMRRAIERDKPWVGDADAIEERYRLHWRPTHEHYEERTRARERCDVVIDNTDPYQPFVIDEYDPIGR